MASAAVGYTVFATTLCLMLLLPTSFIRGATILHEEGVCIAAAVAAVWLLLHSFQRLAGHLSFAEPQPIIIVPSEEASSHPQRESYGCGGDDGLTMSGNVVGGATLVCLCLYFTSEHLHLLPFCAQALLAPTGRDAELKAFLAGECLWQLSLTSALFCVLYVVLTGLLTARASYSSFLVEGQQAGHSGPTIRAAASMTCFALYLTLLPFATVDRAPFPSQPLGCPSVMYLVFAAYAGCVALAGIGVGGALTCCFNGSQLEIRRPPQLRQGGNARREQCCDEAIVLVPSDLLAVLAAALSLLYLLCILPTHLPWAPEALKGPARFIIYHVAWSYLRPVYTMLFTTYILKAMPEIASPVYLAMCSFGMQYFGVFCPLADTAWTHRYSKFCDGGGDLRPLSDATGPYKHYPLGISFHGCEALSFLFSMVLFCWSGVEVQAWSPRMETLVCLGTLGALLVNAISRAMSISTTGWFSTKEDGPDYPVWFLTRYFLGYAVILCAGVWKMLTLGRSGFTTRSTYQGMPDSPYSSKSASSHSDSASTLSV